MNNDSLNLLVNGVRIELVEGDFMCRVAYAKDIYM